MRQRRILGTGVSVEWVSNAAFRDSKGNFKGEFNYVFPIFMILFRTKMLIFKC